MEISFVSAVAVAYCRRGVSEIISRMLGASHAERDRLFVLKINGFFNWMRILGRFALIGEDFRRKRNSVYNGARSRAFEIRTFLANAGIYI